MPELLFWLMMVVALAGPACYHWGHARGYEAGFDSAERFFTSEAYLAMHYGQWRRMEGGAHHA